MPGKLVSPASSIQPCSSKPLPFPSLPHRPAARVPHQQTGKNGGAGSRHHLKWVKHTPSIPSYPSSYSYSSSFSISSAPLHRPALPQIPPASHSPSLPPQPRIASSSRRNCSAKAASDAVPRLLLFASHKLKAANHNSLSCHSNIRLVQGTYFIIVCTSNDSLIIIAGTRFI